MATHGEGAVIGGRYRLEQEIARGGMGSVWAGYDEKLRRGVALKLLVASGSGTAAHARFEREAMAIAQLQSPHVVQIFDYGIELDVPYIVMERLVGEDLRHRLQVQRRLTLETAGRILVHAAKGLSVAHAAGIVHRDLKPGNIFLVRSRDEEIAKVLDFGVAKTDASVLEPDEGGDATVLLDGHTKVGAILGTPQFMAPEQALGASTVDHRADLWSLGVILFRALTGQLPFNAPEASELIALICTATAPSALALAPDLPPETDRFFARALARDPERRFMSAREMAIAFSRLAPVSFPTVSMPEPRLDIALALRSSWGGQAPVSARRPNAAEVDENDEAPTSLSQIAHFPRPDSPRASLVGLGERGPASGPVPPSRTSLPHAPVSLARAGARSSSLPGAAGPASVGPSSASADTSITTEDEQATELDNPSEPTLGGGMSEPSPSEFPSPLRRRSPTDRPWLLAVGAIAAGVLLAVVGSKVAGRTKGPTVIAASVAVDSGARQPAAGLQESPAPAVELAPTAQPSSTASRGHAIAETAADGARARSAEGEPATRPATPEPSGAVAKARAEGRPTDSATSQAVAGKSSPNAEATATPSETKPEPKPAPADADPFSERL